MRINTTSKVLVIAKNERQGSNSKYYDVAVLVDGQAGNFSCSEDAYEMITVNAMNEVIWQYNTEYKSFRIVGIVPSDNTGSDKTQPSDTVKPAGTGKPETAAK